MARNPVNKSDVQEFTTTDPNSEKPEFSGVQASSLEAIPVGDLTAPDKPSKGGAKVDPTTPPEVPKPEQYVVAKDGFLLEKGFRTTLPEGKIIDSNNYDIAALRRKGIKLRPLTEED